MLPRERDIQTHEVIADFDIIDEAYGNATYKETGRWKDAGVGFAAGESEYTGTENPFLTGGSRMAECTAKAKATADQLIQNAEFLKQNRINDATKQVAMFMAMYEQYAQNPEITKVRMYYEALTEALPGVKLYINTAQDGGAEMLLPLESFVNEGGIQ